MPTGSSHRKYERSAGLPPDECIFMTMQFDTLQRSEPTISAIDQGRTNAAMSETELVRSLVILDESNAPKQVNLNQFVHMNHVLLGSDQSAVDIFICSSCVSGRHGKLSRRNGQWRIENLDDINGMQINETPIQQGQRFEIHDGDILRVKSRSDRRETGVLILVSSAPANAEWKRCPLPEPVEGSEFRIGRDPEKNELALSHITVSREHAVLEIRRNAWYLEDRRSRNGTIKNGKLLEDVPTRMNRGDVIFIGNATIIFAEDALFVCEYNRGVSVTVQNVVTEYKKKRERFPRFIKEKKTGTDHVSLTVAPGELVAIVGGSGAGKSTLLNAMSGYFRPKKGEVLINGISLYKNADRMKNLFGYVPQSDIMYKQLTVEQMLRYVARLRLPDTNEREREEAIKKALQTINLYDERNRLINDLSGGQQKRASIAVELVADPPLLFLDEPASGLDPGTERGLMKELRSMTRTGKTIILVTHSTLQLGLCDKIAFIGKGGRLCYYGSEKDALEFFKKSIGKRCAIYPEKDGTIKKINSIVDLYDEMNNNDYASFWQKEYSAVADEQQAQQSEKYARKGWGKARFHAFKALAGRYGQLFFKGGGFWWLAFVFLGPPLLAWLISLMAKGEQFKQMEETKSLLFCLSCTGFTFGMYNTLREICKERNNLKREYMAGLPLSSYVASKAWIHLWVTFLQSILLVIAFALLVGLPEESLVLPPLREWSFISSFYEKLPSVCDVLPSFLEFLLTTWLTILSSAALGLCLSSFFLNKADWVMAIAPIPIIAQMLFSGTLFKLSGILEKASYGIICRWSIAGYGTIANLNGLETALEQKHILLPREADTLFEYTSWNLVNAWVALLLFILLFLVVTRIVLGFFIKKRSEG